MRARVLTGRQRQLLRAVANGNTNETIGRQYGIHRVTVDRHLQNIYRLLGARDRANAVAIAFQVGELDHRDIQLPAHLTKDAA
jgi:DNA-binding NarL/FixJ family response regulator